MAQIKIDHLSFEYEGSYEEVFDSVSFILDSDWKSGCIGRNGKGKTTLLQLLRGKLKGEGEILHHEVMDYFPFEVKNQNQLTLDIVNEIAPLAQDWEIIKELSLLDVNAEVLYRPYNTLSFGERTKVQIVTLFLNENHFLLIDEPTNHLDIKGRQALATYLNSKKGFILVSHDRTFLDACIDHVLSLERNKIEVIQGNYSKWYQGWLRQNEFEANENEKLKKEIIRLKNTAQEKTCWADQLENTKNGTKISGLKADKGAIGAQAARTMKKAKNAERRMNRAIDEKEGLLKNIEVTSALKIVLLIHHSSIFVRVENLCVGYEDKIVVGPISFTVFKNERIAIMGPNGCGKSSLIKAIVDQKAPISGIVKIAPGLKIGYVSQDTSFLSGGLMDYAKEQQLDVTLFLTLLRKMDFRRELFDRDMKKYSEGQKKKVLIATSLSKPSHLLIWDEPLNYIDVFSRIQIENLILTSSLTMLIIEHDIAFINKVATTKIELE